MTESTEEAVAAGFLAAAESLVLQARVCASPQEDDYVDQLLRAIMADLTECREVLMTAPWSRRKPE